MTGYPARPVGFILLDRMPLTTIGKVDYRALEDMVNNKVK